MLAAISGAVTGMFAAREDPQAFLVEDIRFHAAVASASGNPILASVVEMISAMFYEHRPKTADRRRVLRPSQKCIGRSTRPYGTARQGGPRT